MYPPVTQFETRALRLQAAVEEPLRVVVAEDSVLRRAGIVRLLIACGFDVVLRRQARAHRPRLTA